MTAGRRVILAGVLGWLVLTPVVAWAHASLVRSAPARRAVLSRAPSRVQLWFNERLEPNFSKVSVQDAAGTQVDAGEARVGPDNPRLLSVGLRPLAPGAYTVKFRVLSVDGHIVEGELSFTVQGSQ